ncbi:MAG TPA: LysR family transcriptional regulator [Chloroflexota bacterium]|jgi:DNA-binding transcriptional LysR family regulator|nr:LysR family transcriptional regulator [Chloroflexota bacterium]
MERVPSNRRQRSEDAATAVRSSTSVRVGDLEDISLADSVLNPVRLAVFCTVVERRSFNRAAEALCVTPSAVSLHVRALEALWQTPLFDRRRRGAHLTEAGKAAYEYAITVLRETANLRAHLRDLAGGNTGLVTIGATMVPGTYFLPPILAQFRARRPKARIQLLLHTPEALVDEVLRSQVDLAVGPEIIPLTAALHAEPVWTEAMLLVAPASHPLARATRVQLTDLVHEPFVVSRSRTVGDRMLDTALARAGLPPRHIVLEVGPQEIVKHAVLAGTGLAVLLRCVVAGELARGELIALPLEHVPMSERFYLLYRPTHRFTPLANHLVAAIRSQARKLAEQAPY